MLAAFRNALAVSLALMLAGCSQLTIAWAPMTPKGEAASPPIEAKSAVAFDEQRSSFEQALQNDVYGTLPTGAELNIIDYTEFGPGQFGESSRFEEHLVEVAPRFGTETGTSAQFIMAVVSPAGDGPFPVIMVETFCPRWIAIPHPNATMPVDAEQKPAPGFVRFLFGRYICTPPIEEILSRGYAVAVVAATDVVPDDSDRGLAALQALDPLYDQRESSWGAIGAWGWVFSQMVDVLRDQPRYDPDRLIAYGHSRYGKAALVAAAFDGRIAGVIAHQSGTGGASLSRQKAGESVKAITKSYPHWFSPRYASFSGREDELSIDQHHLLALIAPRPVLLGNARRDVWSDPNGAFKAAMAADNIYALYGADDMIIDRLDNFRPEQPLAFWLRPGTHGIVKEDWPAFLRFLDAHFQTADENAQR